MISFFVLWNVTFAVTPPREVTLIADWKNVALPVFVGRSLLYHFTYGVWIVSASHTIQHYLSHCNLTSKGLIAGFEIRIERETFNLALFEDKVLWSSFR